MTPSSLRKVFLFRGLFAALVFLLLGSHVWAPGEPGPRVLSPEPEEPTLGFSWAQTNRDLGTVTVPGATATGWSAPGYAWRYRQVPAFASDPTFEVVVTAPDSGHDSLPERFLLQYPRNWASKPSSERVLVVAFHSYSVSEKQIFLDTDLPFECAQRGWMLFAPYGLRDTNFANTASQASLETILLQIYNLLGYNHERVYGVGFSMGGLCATSYAMRHLDPGSPRFAAVLSHTGTVDMVREYDRSDAFAQQRLRNPWHFGAAPALDPYAYDRVSPARFFPSGLLDASRAPISSALHLPFYIHLNLADPNTEILAEAMELKNFLSFRGATVHELLVNDPVAGHSWSTLPMGPALDVLSQHTLPSNPPNFEAFADRSGVWLYSEVHGKSPDRHARYEIEVSPLNLPTVNSFRISETRDLDVVALRLRAMGLDPALPLTFECSSIDNSDDVYVLKGYPAPPAGVRIVRAGRSSWSHDPVAQELVIRVELRYGAAQVVILP